MNETFETTKQALLDIKKHDAEFLKIIRNKLGLAIHKHQLSDLHKTILTACRRLHCTPDEYLFKLQISLENSAIFENLIAGITVGETYFFRDQNQMTLLSEQIIPELIRHKRMEHKLALRIWSAGCATGEEIYTLAIILRESLPDLSQWSLHLLGTDINTQALKKAMQGNYSEWSMRTINAEYKNKYFTKENNQYVLTDSIRDMVNFNYLNLTDTSFPTLFAETNAQDLILCRNVLIYFDNEIILNLMKRFSESLAPKGYLLLGASDPIITQGTSLHFEYQQGALFSHRKAAKKVINTILEIEPAVIPNVISPTTQIKPPAIKKENKPESNITETMIQDLLNKSKWEEALFLIEHTPNKLDAGFLLSAKAFVYANMGKLKEAVHYAEKSIKLNPNNIYAYFTLGMALTELNQLHDAIAIFRKAIFLDYQFVLGHYQLGLLLLRNKENALGLKSLHNAFNIAKTHPPEAVVPYFKGLNYGRLKEIFLRELELHEKNFKDDIL